MQSCIPNKIVISSCFVFLLKANSEEASLCSTHRFVSRLLVSGARSSLVNEWNPANHTRGPGTNVTNRLVPLPSPCMTPTVTPYLTPPTPPPPPTFRLLIPTGGASTAASLSKAIFSITLRQCLGNYCWQELFCFYIYY